MKNKDMMHLLTWIVGFQLIGPLLGLLTKVKMNPWYELLEKSSLTPPGFVFSIVWTILYTLLAIAGYLLWSAKKFKGQDNAKLFYGLQMICNWSWTPLFFYLHKVGLSLASIVCILIFTSSTMYYSYKKLIKVVYLLLPYLLWCSFALYLNLYIWCYN